MATQSTQATSPLTINKISGRIERTFWNMGNLCKASWLPNGTDGYYTWSDKKTGMRIKQAALNLNAAELAA